jgi:uncharacterized OB-fold protein
MTKASYPAPREDADNAAFLEAWRQGKLMVQLCAACSRSIFYPRPICPYCWSDRIESREASGRGRIVSYSLVHRPNDPSFNDEIPIVLAEVALDEGPSLIARIVDCRSEDVRSNRAVELPPRSACARYPLPVFRLAGGE